MPSKIQAEAIRRGKAEYYAMLARQEIAKLAMDSENPGARYKQFVEALKRELDPRSFEIAMRVLKGQDADASALESAAENWDADDPATRELHRKSSSFDAMFGENAKRIGQDICYGRQPAKPLGVGMDSDPAGFYAMYPELVRKN